MPTRDLFAVANPLVKTERAWRCNYVAEGSDWIACWRHFRWQSLQVGLLSFAWNWMKDCVNF